MLRAAVWVIQDFRQKEGRGRFSPSPRQWRVKISKTKQSGDKRLMASDSPTEKHNIHKEHFDVTPPMRTPEIINKYFLYRRYVFWHKSFITKKTENSKWHHCASFWNVCMVTLEGWFYKFDLRLDFFWGRVRLPALVIWPGQTRTFLPYKPGFHDTG